MARTLSNPTVQVNDVTIAIIPNSLSYKTGTGNKTVKSSSAGGDSIEIIVTDDVESKKSMVKFKLFTTAANLAAVKSWTKLYSSTIRVSEAGAAVESFSQMVIINEPERAIGADGELEVEWEGAPVL